jgi:hypothetical protein
MGGRIRYYVRELLPEAGAVAAAPTSRNARAMTA